MNPELFFKWIVDYVDGYKYKKLLNELYNEEFIAVNKMDFNRIMDGIELRYKFGESANLPKEEMDSLLDQKPCSILEMMLALAIRMEDTIMGDSDYGDRTKMWFWMMVKSLGLYNMTNDKINYEEVRNITYRFINRHFERNGSGGLFTVHGSKKDFRELEIWYQMCMFSDSLML